jgi:hypothetical protein
MVVPIDHAKNLASYIACGVHQIEREAVIEHQRAGGPLESDFSVNIDTKSNTLLIKVAETFRSHQDDQIERSVAFFAKSVGDTRSRIGRRLIDGHERHREKECEEDDGEEDENEEDGKREAKFVERF